MTTPDTKTRRIFHYAEVLEGEPHEPNGEGYKCWREPKTGNSYAYSAGAAILHPEWMPVNQLPETTEPVPPAPRIRTRIVFEECDKANWTCDTGGHKWYRRKGDRRLLWADGSNVVDGLIVRYNRTEEVITGEPPEPERWVGWAEIHKCGTPACWASVELADSCMEITGKVSDHYKDASADLARLKALAEQYAAQHGAVIEWEESK